RLDYSSESLNVLEAWILDRYQTIGAMMDRYELTRTDDIGRYIGEVFRKHLGGKWDVELGNPRKAFFELPYLQGTEEHLYVDCPLTIGTAAVDRRTGTFIRELFENARTMTPEYFQENYGHLGKSKTLKKPKTVKNSSSKT
nr:hypothetical protein [Armatimonadota bacterium]